MEREPREHLAQLSLQIEETDLELQELRREKEELDLLEAQLQASAERHRCAQSPIARSRAGHRFLVAFPLFSPACTACPETPAVTWRSSWGRR